VRRRAGSNWQDKESRKGKRGEERERRKWRNMALCPTETKSWLCHCIPL